MARPAAPPPGSLKQSALLALIRLWMASWRLRWPAGADLPERGVLVLWHEHLPACIPAFARRGVGVLISLSGDGAFAADACGRLGYKVYRGSGSRGALSGLRALARGLAGGLSLAGMALDGPRGPRRDPKPGSLWLAGVSGLPIHPIAIRASWALRLKTWDRCLLPLPFAKVEVRVGPPCHPADAGDVLAAMENNQAALESA